MNLTTAQSAVFIMGLALGVVATSILSLSAFAAIPVAVALGIVLLVPVWSIRPTVSLWFRTVNACPRAFVGCYGLLLVAVVATVVLGSPEFVRDGVDARYNLTRYGLGVVLVVGGTVGLPIAIGNLRYYRLVRRADRTRPLEGGDPVVATGTVTAFRDGGHSSDEDEVVCRQWVTRRRGGGRVRAPGHYVADHDLEGSLFYVSQSSNAERTLVVPVRFTLELESASPPVMLEEPESLLAEDESSVAVSDHEIAGVGPSVPGEDSDSVDEKRLQVGETVCVVGEAAADPDARYAEQTVVGAGGSPVLIADRSLEATATTLRQRVYGGAIGGLVAVIGYALLVSGAF